MRALITGITGQDGSYLAEFLLAKGYEVHGTVRRSSCLNTSRIDHLYASPHTVPAPKLFLHHADLLDAGSLSTVLATVQPDEIYHLGAQTHVAVSYHEPEYTMQVGALGTLRLLDGIRRVCPKARTYNASSSEMFGSTFPMQSEQSLFNPVSPYGVAKVAAHELCRVYRESYGLWIANGILFNHEGDGRRGETFVTRKITLAAARIKMGLQDKLYLGNLDAKRDWGYAPEYVEAMYLMLQQDAWDDFVIATGEMHTVREFVAKAFGCLDMDWQDHVIIDPRYVRPLEVLALQGNARKAERQLGWTPKTTFNELVRLMVISDVGLAQREKLVADYKSELHSLDVYDGVEVDAGQVSEASEPVLGQKRP
jgi:GDPmannose 4,6-dehydratase